MTPQAILYNKRDNFDLSSVHFPHLSSRIMSSLLFMECFLWHIWCTQICSHHRDIYIAWCWLSGVKTSLWNVTLQFVLFWMVFLIQLISCSIESFFYIWAFYQWCPFLCLRFCNILLLYFWSLLFSGYPICFFIVWLARRYHTLFQNMKDMWSAATVLNLPKFSECKGSSSG